MKLIVYDCEVFQNDWLVVFKDHESGIYVVVHNDNEKLKECINDDNIYVGFNNKHYDRYIIKAICCDFSPEEVKQVNDFIMDGHQGWEYPGFKDVYFQFNNVDTMDDVQRGLSLKAIEGHLGMNIQESDVPFDIDRPLTKSELRRTEHYCKHDVDATEALMEIRKGYFKTKENLGKRAGIDTVKALSATNAKLTAMMLHAQRKEWTDGRDYVYPENLDTEVIPKEILDFFDRIHDESIPDEELFSTFLEIDIGGMPCKYAWGGVHGSLTGYHEKAEGSRVIENRDVSSLYPTLLEKYHYLSRNVPDPGLFYTIRRDRIQAKHDGDKQTAADLKLPLNTVSGAQENPYNDLYDPLPTRSLRITGQLFLTVLAERLLNGCKTIKLLNFNTDGLMYSIDRKECEKADTISAIWENETGLELEIDNIQEVWIKDVNNLLVVKKDGEIKTVGGYLNYGVSTKGAWTINNSMIIVKKALIDYFTKGIAVEDTINASSDILDFQIIAKASAKYREVYQIVDGKKVPVQKTNRVYATSDERYGKLYKVKEEDASVAQIEMLPEHCMIDNDNSLALNEVDRSFYIDVAKKRVNDFLGVVPEKKITRRSTKMAATKEAPKPLNAHQKLLQARLKFLEANAKKSGKNMNLSFKYFELEDIVPTATRIFHEVGLIPIVNFTQDAALMDMVNADNPEDSIAFSAPFKQISPIVSNTGRQVTNELQALGASITYMRRYLYMIALDICESDEIDANLGTPVSTPQQKAPVTLSERKEVKAELTAPDDKATALQLKGLKSVLKKLKDSNPAKEEYVAQIAIQTKGFTEISKSECEKLINQITEMLDDGKD